MKFTHIESYRPEVDSYHNNSIQTKNALNNNDFILILAERDQVLETYSCEYIHRFFLRLCRPKELTVSISMLLLCQIVTD